MKSIDKHFNYGWFVVTFPERSNAVESLPAYSDSFLGVNCQILLSAAIASRMILGGLVTSKEKLYRFQTTSNFWRVSHFALT